MPVWDSEISNYRAIQHIPVLSLFEMQENHRQCIFTEYFCSAGPVYLDKR